MKELLDIYLEKRVKEMLVYGKSFDEKFKTYRDKAALLSEADIPDKELIKRLEEDNFELMATHKDFENISTEIEVILDIYKKTRQELPEGYKNIVKDIEGYTEPRRSNIYTFVVENGELVEREKGILKVRLKMVKESQAYKDLEKIREAEETEETKEAPKKKKK